MTLESILRREKGQISGRAFIYILGIMVVTLVLVFGYRSIADIGGRADASQLISLKNSLSADVQSLSAEYGSATRQSYPIGDFEELCLADLTRKRQILSSEIIDSYPLIRDSIESDTGDNVFAVDGSGFDSWNAGPVRLNHFPYFTCIEAQQREVAFWMEGTGDHVLIMEDFISSAEAVPGQETRLRSTDGMVSLAIPAGAVDSPTTFSIEITELGSDEEKGSDMYKFEPSGTTFNKPVELTIKYNPVVVGQCPDELNYYLYHDDGTLKDTIFAQDIDCEAKRATFPITGFSFGHVGVSSLGGAVNGGEVSESGHVPGPLTKSRIGLGEVFTVQWLEEQGITCPTCPSNVVPLEKQTIEEMLTDLHSNQQMHAFRDGIAMELLEPREGENPNYGKLLEIIDLYEERDMTLVLYIGKPLPDWMIVNDHEWCPMPTDDADWQVLQERMAATIARFIDYLWDDPRISKDWLRSRFYLEGVNEFEAWATNTCTDSYWDRSFSTPERAADLQQSIQRELNQEGVQITTLTPSIVGVFGIYGGLEIEESYGRWFEEYYAHGGGGYPAVHIYPGSGAASGMTAKVRDVIERIDAGLPQDRKGKIFLTETGASMQTAQCPGGIPENVREEFFESLILDESLQQKLSMILFWRVLYLPTEHGCQATYGVRHRDSPGYSGAAMRIFDYLKEGAAPAPPPNGLTAQCSEIGIVTMEWEPPNGEGGFEYAVRANKDGGTDGLNTANDCERDADDPDAEGDVCFQPVGVTSYSFEGEQGASYTVWVHSGKESQWNWEDLASVSVECPLSDPDSDTYSWHTTSWSQCTESCGGGEQTRTVECRSSDGRVVADTQCSGSKPELTQGCNEQACGSQCELLEAYWERISAPPETVVALVVEGESCGDQEEATIHIEENDVIGNDQIATLQAIFDDDRARTQWTTEWREDAFGDPEYQFVASVGGSSVSSRNQLKVSRPTTYSWHTTSWSQCTESCGGGEQTRTVECRSDDGRVVDASHCSGQKPARVQSCNEQACPPTASISAIYERTSFTSLQGYHGGCNKDTTAEGACSAAAHRYCRSHYRSSGFGILEWNGDDAAISCLSPSSHEAVDVTSTTFGVLSGKHLGCTSSNAISAECNTAVHRYCRDNGFGSGFGPVEYSGSNAQMVCVTRNGADIKHTSFTTLNQHHTLCTQARAMSDNCNSAISRFCSQQGYTTGFGPVEMSGNNVQVVCVR